jgi:hypothetical protein
MSGDMLKYFRTNNKKLTLKDKFHFGKYAGYTIMDIIERDPSYVRWCLNTIEYFKLDDTAFQELEVREIEDETGRAESRSRKFYGGAGWIAGDEGEDPHAWGNDF